jgi:uncharacterized membrane protein (DUF441 family)
MIEMLRDWLWLIIFLPLWVLGTAAAIALAVSVEVAMRAPFPESFYAWSAAGGLALAIIVLGLIHCLFPIGLPFAVSVCRS